MKEMQVEFNCPECQHKLVADVDIDKIVKQRLDDILRRLFQEEVKT